jgi:hypothetical protein
MLSASLFEKLNLAAIRYCRDFVTANSIFTSRNLPVSNICVNYLLITLTCRKWLGVLLKFTNKRLFLQILRKHLNKK